MSWEEEVLVAALSARARRAGAAYAGPGAGNDIPTSARPPIAFTGGLPDPILLPANALAAATAAALAENPDASLQYGGAQGFLRLREWLASHWSGIEGIELSPANFTMANGSAGALANICDTFVDPGDVVFVEAPSFPGSIRAIHAATGRVESIHVDLDGIDVDDLEARIADVVAAGERPRLLYVIPSFHNPTGSTLTIERRERLLDICARAGILIVEDNAYGELWFDSLPPLSLYAMAAGDGVIRIGTFSKVVAPGLRAGFCMAHPRVIEALVATRHDMGTSSLLLRALDRFVRADEFGDHLDAIRTAYARKCRVMLDALDDHCAGLATWNRPDGGFFIWMCIDDSLDPLVLGDRARDEGVLFVGGHVFFAEQHAAEGPRPQWGPGDSQWLRLAFSYVAEDQIADGVARLGKALTQSTR